MRTVVASSLALSVLLLFACASDYSSDDPAAKEDPDGGGASSSGSSGTTKEGGVVDNEGGVTPGKPITVSGKIIAFGVGMPNIPVVVGGKTAVNTSTLGTFSVPDVTPPYDVMFALKTSDAQPRVTMYQGLTRSDPTLVAVGPNGELRPTATTATSLAGTVEVENVALPFARAPVLAFVGPNRSSGFAMADLTTGTYTMMGTDTPTWYGTQSVTGTIHAGLVLDNLNPVKAFYGKLDNVAVTAATAATDKKVALNSVAVGSVEAKITAPSTYNDPTKTVVQLGIRYQDAAGYFVRSTNPGPFPASVKRAVPLVGGASFQTSIGYSPGGDAEASFARVTGTSPATTEGTLDVALAAAPQQTEPAAGAKVGRSSTFTFTAFPGGIQRFNFVAANQPSVTIITAGTSATLPDLAPFAITIPNDVEYTWRVIGYAPLTSIDANELPAIVATGDGSLPNVEQAHIAFSTLRKVTLQP